MITKFTVIHDSETGKATIEVEKLPGLTEGQTLMQFCSDIERLCRVAIAADADIETVQAVCGAVEYTAFNPKKVLEAFLKYEQQSDE
jgi:hypothetical protein